MEKENFNSETIDNQSVAEKESIEDTDVKNVDREKTIAQETVIEESSIKDFFEDEVCNQDGEKKPSNKKAKRQIKIGFVLGILTTVVVIMVLSNVIGVLKLMKKSDYDYYTFLADKYGKYDDIIDLIEDDPLAEQTVDDINDDMLREIVANTGDPYAEYFTKEEYSVFLQQFTGEYIGVGIGVRDEDEKVVIKYVIKDGPAADAGIKKNDAIVEINGKKPETSDDALIMLDGKSGTDVNIKVKRGEKEIPFNLTLTRLKPESVFHHRYSKEDKIGYIGISEFREGTYKEFKKAVKSLKAKGYNKIIIDLTDNGGGLTDESIDIADYLLKRGKIMTDVEKNGKETVYNSDNESADIEYVVLVNENTASASEILTAAIQDNKGGKIIGTPTYGKGVTQETTEFKDGTAVKVTVSEYFRPSGKKVNEVGITPDIETATYKDSLSKALEILRGSNK